MPEPHAPHGEVVGERGLPERATIESPKRGEAAERLVVNLRAVVGPVVLVLGDVKWLLAIAAASATARRTSSSATLSEASSSSSGAKHFKALDVDFSVVTQASEA